MSSIFRVFKFNTYLNRTTKFLINNAHVIESSSSLSNIKLPCTLGPIKIYERTYSAQNLHPKNDLIHSQSVTRDLESEFQFLDSILKRGSFLKKRTVESLVEKVALARNVTPSQALFLLNCCGNSLGLENKAVRRKLGSQIWKIFQEKDLTLDISHYNALLQIFVENEADFSPLDFLAMLEEKNIVPNRVTYSRLIAKFCQKGDIDGANKILEHMKNKGLEINEYIFCSLILGNARANDLDGALSILDIMKKSGIETSSITYAALIQAYGEHQKVDEIDRILSEGKTEGQLNEKSILDIVNILADQSQPSIIEKILNFLENENEKNFPVALTRLASSRLLSSGHDELAFKVFKMQPRQENQNNVGTYFPRLIAASDLDLYKVVNYCEDMRKSGFNVLSFELALEGYIQEGKFESAMALIRVMRDRGITLKEHYFYPLLLNISKEQNRERTLNFLEELNSYEIPLSVTFYCHFLLPSMNINNIDDLNSIYNRIYNICETKGIHTLYNGFVDYIIHNFGLGTTAEFVNQNRRGLMPYLGPIIADYYLDSLKPEETAQILRQFLPLDIRMQREFIEEDLEHRYDGIKGFFGIAIRELRKRNNFDVQMSLLLKAMQSNGVYLIPSVAEYLTNKFGESMNPDIQEALDKLSDPSLISSSSNRNVYGKTSLRQKILESEASGDINESLNFRLFLNLINNKKFEEADEVIQKLKSNDIALPPAVQILLISTYIDTEMYEKAEQVLNEFVETYPDFQISPVKIAKIAKMFVDTDRVEDAIKCILINSPENGNWPSDQMPNHDSFYYRNVIVNMLNNLVEKSDESTLKRMQEALIDRKFSPTSWVMAPTVSYHVRQNNIEEALACYEKYAKEYQIAAGKRELTLACIKEEDTDKLQKVLDISNEIYGELTTLYDLVFAFLEAGKVVQAERVLQTSGFRARDDKLMEQCKYYVRTGRIEQLKNLINITKNVFNVNREKLYSYLLEAYIVADDPDSSLGVWTTMQEENLNPDDDFLHTLGNYLQARGRSVPFSIPSRNPVKKETSPIPTDFNSMLKKAIESENVNSIKTLLENHKETGEGLLSVNQMSKILDIYLKHGMTSMAVSLTREMLEKDTIPHQRVLKNLFNDLEKSGDVASMEHLGKYMKKEVKALCLYSFHVASAMVENGRAKELFETIAKNVQGISDSSADNDDLKYTLLSFPRLLDKQPELYPEATNILEMMKNNDIPKVKELTQKLSETLYQYVFLTGNYEEAEKLYEEYIKDQNNFAIRRICNRCFKENNFENLEKLLEVARRKTEGREKIKGIIYSTHIDILRKEEKFEDALNVIKKSLEEVKLEDYLLFSLESLKRKMEAKNLSFPYEIKHLRKSESSSSSSSSSDSDKEK